MDTVKLKGCNYLSNHINKLPSHCLLNKGITGCGGTTVELQSSRNSIILCPTRNLVECKANLGYFKVDGTVKETQIINYVNNTTGFKKIVATYDALPKLMKFTDYFLLIDEYHLLFNEYSFRNEAIMYILKNFRKFDNWCFMTATPLKDEFILEELKDIKQITYEWEETKPVDIDIIDTYYTTKEVINLIDKHKDKNLHIFLNSVKTITNIVNKLNLDNYRIVCSVSSKSKVTNYADITSPVKKINFYTSCAFEGCDIYDRDGLGIIVSDTNIATTVLDITTKVRQVCGRLRDSKYKDKVILVLNTTKHRYAGVSKNEFLKKIEDSEKSGKNIINLYNRGTEEEKLDLASVFSFETHSTKYVNKYNNTLFLDPNLKSLDVYNYNLISEIYNTCITVLMECEQIANNVQVLKSKSKGLEWIKQYLKPIEYTYQELEDIFIPLFKEHGLKWDRKNSIKLYFPSYTSKRKQKNGKREMYYRFNNF